MNEWFTVELIDGDTVVISEYRHWEETHSYLLRGRDRCLLIDTGLGIGDIHAVVSGLTDRPVVAVATHIHWDHIGGHRQFPEFYAHEAEVSWLQGAFPLPTDAVRAMVTERCDLPEGFDAKAYTVFQGEPTCLLSDEDVIDLGDRQIRVLHTPGHSPGHLCFFEEERGSLFTGDLAYKGVLLADFPSTDPVAYRRSLARVASLPVRRVLPAHHSLDIAPEILTRMSRAFDELTEAGSMHHGSGLFDFGDFSIRL